MSSSNDTSANSQSQTERVPLAPDAFRAALAAGRIRVEQERQKSPADIAQEKQLDHEKKKQEVLKAALANENEKALIGLRKAYGVSMIVFLWAYFVAAMTLISLHSIHQIVLPEGVAIALIGGTAVSVLGVVGTIVAGLFRIRSD